MVTASQLRVGMAIKFEGQRYKVVAAEYHGGQGKMGGATHTASRIWIPELLGAQFPFGAEDRRNRTGEQALEFLYADGGQCCFMNPETYEQTEVAREFVGEPQAGLLETA